MNKLLLVVLSLATISSSFAQSGQPSFVATDIDHFWAAYEKITATADTLQQHNLLRTLYLEKGTEGLKSLIEARDYSDQAFLEVINSYPEFWMSIRTNTLNLVDQYPVIEKDIEKLKTVYPQLRPATIYFLMGVFRTGGTIVKNRIVIGSELSLADKSTKTNELPLWRQPFYKENPLIAGLPLLCVHEYVHTQQQDLVQNLLSMCLYEGVAEFVSCKATGKKSDSPAIEFGKANPEAVMNQFIRDLFIMSNNNNWMWGENRNDLKTRDLGYYVGYEICERYYNLATDKIEAIKELIDLDYTNEKEVERIVNLTHFLPKTVQALNDDYEKQRPAVVSLTPFNNGSNGVRPGMTKITITFSEPLNGHNTGIDFGPLGEGACPKLKPERVWSADRKTWTFEADLKPDQRYQILISNNFRKENGVRLKPYLIDFKTREIK